MSQLKPKGAVMIIGGGIAGIQAALSLAKAHYGVNLVERSSALGGMIPNLHRLYPICACCKLDPRIAACEQEPNINIMLDTTVVNITGQVGDFEVTLEHDEQQKTVKAGAILLAAGIETFDPAKYDTYSYGRFSNVLTSAEFENLQKPLGPEMGVLKRPSDGQVAKKIAWLQCVGSRDINQCDASYCSAVCCMHALKETMTALEFDEDIETAIFYMDMRSHGKGYEDYLNKAISKGVRLIRSRVHTVDPVPGNDDLEIVYADDGGKLHKEVFNMVVLSVGLRASTEAIELARKIGLDLDEDHYIATRPFQPATTSVPGIFVCGGVAGPNDIAQSLNQSAAAVSEIASVLEPEPFASPKVFPTLSRAQHKQAKVLLAYHLCPGMDPRIGPDVEKIGRKLPEVVATIGLEDDAVKQISQKLGETGANRVVLASCTPLIHKNLVEEALRWAGLNPYLYDTVDLRVIDSESLYEQLHERIRMGVVRSSHISPPPLKDVRVIKHALVVGGGVTGLQAALSLAEQGYPVTIVEQEKDIGGHGRHVRGTWQGHDAQKFLNDLVASVEKNRSITVLTETTVKENKGFAGKFVTTLQRKGKSVDLTHGVTILAPGGDPVKPAEYLYGHHKNIYLWSELSDRMIKDPLSIEKADTGVFIQCVGSREPERPHCSNLCCSFAVRTALDLKAKNPSMSIYILYREMRTFGQRENLYRDARNKGVIFVRYDLEHKPFIEPSHDPEKIKITVQDPILERPVSIEADFVSLQTAIVGTNNQALAEIFKVGLDSNGFFAESPEKLKPIHTTRDGVYVAGLAHYPKDTGESITQAKAAAAVALEILSQDKVQVGGMVAEVNPEKCAVCCTCVRTCPFNVPYIDHEIGAAYIDPALCQGCGMCVAECPGKAIVMGTCSDQMLTEAPSFLLAGS